MLSLLFATAAYWTVHIDVPAKRAEFERIDAQYNAAIREFYAAHHLQPPEVWHLVTSDGAHIGLRPRGSMADLATPQLPPELSKELQTKTAPISVETHKILRAHHSELWHVERDLTTAFVPKKYALLRVDVVDPPRDDEYDKAMKQLVKELAAKGVDTIGFFSSYGDGAYHYIFTSDKRFRVPGLRGFGETRDISIARIETQ